ncbi:DUF6344 domain-containing protein [Streptomyces sp. NPDC004539]|uniref:DUF6344 domain-containing protein n=1 Tax=Streptomyces sp. NPDC004539 TaxID=3154280 RepID=UPI0033B64C5A
MARTQLKNLWTTVITALLALCTALGLITTAATAAVAQSEPARNTATAPQSEPPLLPGWDRPHPRSLPPTMKQRIRAEAHGKSPNCRHRSHPDTDSLITPAHPSDHLPQPEPATPLQH